MGAKRLPLTNRYVRWFGPCLTASPPAIADALLNALAASDSHVVVLQGELVPCMTLAQELLAASRNTLVQIGKRRLPVGAIVETAYVKPRELRPFTARMDKDARRLCISILPGLPPAGLQAAAVAVVKAGFRPIVPLPLDFPKADRMTLWTAVERAKPLAGRGIFIEQPKEG